MAYIPQNAEWYVGELVEEITVEGDDRNVVHRNLVLIRAKSPEEAYEKALALGREGEISYENPDGKRVSTRFRGLCELSVIYDELTNGAELLYKERIGVPEHEVQKWIAPKEQLSVFRPKESRKVPDYSSKEIVEEAEKMMKGSKT